jgi:hypothetical protein
MPCGRMHSSTLFRLERNVDLHLPVASGGESLLLERPFTGMDILKSLPCPAAPEELLLHEASKVQIILFSDLLI